MASEEQSGESPRSAVPALRGMQIDAIRAIQEFLVLQPGMLTSAELRFGAVGVRGQPPSIMGGC
ncbi:hypothetical protein, partial [Micromonospora chalcea]